MLFRKRIEPTRMIVKVINHSKHQLPDYQTALAAGMDLCANLSENIVLQPLGRILIPTGLYMEIPAGYEAQIRPRSGLAFKHGITVLNSPGTIDADYRGEIKVLLVNLSAHDFVIADGERIAQMVIAPHARVQLLEVVQIDETKRGEGGFGSTGK